MKKLLAFFVLIISACSPESRCITTNQPFYTDVYGVFVHPRDDIDICPFEIDFTISFLIKEFMLIEGYDFTTEKLEASVREIRPALIITFVRKLTYLNSEYGGLYYLTTHSVYVSKKDDFSSHSLAHELIHHLLLGYISYVEQYDHSTPGFWRVTSGEHSVEAHARKRLSEMREQNYF